MRISCNIYALGFMFKIENLLDIGWILEFPCVLLKRTNGETERV